MDRRHDRADDGQRGLAPAAMVPRLAVTSWPLTRRRTALAGGDGREGKLIQEAGRSGPHRGPSSVPVLATATV